MKQVACILTKGGTHYFDGETEEECFRKIQAWRNRMNSARPNGRVEISFSCARTGARFAVFNRFHPYNGF